MRKTVTITFIKNFFLVLLIFFSVNAYAKNVWIVEDIKFEGLQNISQKKILKNIFFNIGSKISKYDIQNSIRSLFKTGKFKDIEVMYLKKTIIFKIKERPIISSIVISGNNIIKNSILDKYLIQLGIKSGNLLNPFFINIFIKNIKNFYHDHARYGAKIQILKIPSINNSIHLKIIISEGSLTKVKSIKVFGNKSFSKEKIMSLFKLKDHNPWWNFFEKCIYSSKELKNDLKNLSNFYLNQGYFYFNIDKKQVNFFKDKRDANITINISEGQKYRISHFFVNGNVLNYYDLILDIISIHNNEIYSQEKINIIVDKIKTLLSERGYIKTQIIVDPKINHQSKTIILNFNIDIKKRYFVRRIDFIGNELTKDLVLRRAMKQIEGKYFNIKKVEEGKNRLEKTRYFDNVQITYNIVPYTPNEVDIVYQVQERATGSVNFGLGYGFDNGLSFNSVFSQDNLLGSGNSLKVSAIKNKNQKYADISISYPYFFSQGNDLNTRLFYSDKKYSINNVLNFSKKTYGFEGNLGFEVNDTNKVNIGLGYTHNDSIVNSEKKDISLLLKEQISDFSVLKNSLLNDYALNYSWMHNSLKYLYFPVSGNQMYISGKNTIPGSDNNFYKITLDNEEYIPLNQEQNFIFLSHIYMGIGSSFNQNKLPFYENFSVNSSSNIRGFQANTIGPKTIYNSANLQECVKIKSNNFCESTDSIGGNTAIVSNLEIITPIPLVDKKYSKFLRSSFFLDIGNIWNTNLNNIKNISLLKFPKFNNLKNIYSSFGVSLQWFSPIGPLVFSYAHPIQKNSDHQLESFQFNFGKNW